MTKKFTKIVEAHGVSIRLFDRGGVIYRDVSLGRVQSESGKIRTRHDIKSLGHGDRKLAEQQAKALAAEIGKSRLTGATLGRVTLGQLFSMYQQHRLPKMEPQRQKEALARITMFCEAWGAQMNVLDVDQTRVDDYCEARRTMEIIAPGKRVGPNGEKRHGYRPPKPIRDGGLDAEFRWLRSVLNWGRGY
jgi:hypothetical protein